MNVTKSSKETVDNLIQSALKEWVVGYIELNVPNKDIREIKERPFYGFIDAVLSKELVSQEKLVMLFGDVFHRMASIIFDTTGLPPHRFSFYGSELQPKKHGASPGEEASPIDVPGRDELLRGRILQELTRKWPDTSFDDIQGLDLHSLLITVLRHRFLTKVEVYSVINSCGFNLSEMTALVSQAAGDFIRNPVFPVISARIGQDPTPDGSLRAVHLVARIMDGEEERVLVFDKNGIGVAGVVSNTCFDTICVIQSWMDFPHQFTTEAEHLVLIEDFLKQSIFNKVYLWRDASDIQKKVVNLKEKSWVEELTKR